jgi:hypothetical protein
MVCDETAAFLELAGGIGRPTTHGISCQEPACAGLPIGGHADSRRSAFTAMKRVQPKLPWRMSFRREPLNHKPRKGRSARSKRGDASLQAFPAGRRSRCI